MQNQNMLRPVFLLAWLCALSMPQTAFPEDTTPIPQPPAAQVAQYQAREAKSVLELQQFRETTAIDIQDSAHMNLPLDESQMASRGSRDYGYTEMKGSWFIFDSYKAHEDWCRWRAPFWHGSRVLDAHSHHNYHLGFRCCQTRE